MMDESESSSFKLPKSKKLLVLDLDNTLCDVHIDDDLHVTRGREVIRPYLHSFLAAVYEYYNIVIWSATHKPAIDAKLIAFGMVPNNVYKILFTLNIADMITTKTLAGNVLVKPLAKIWRKFSEFNEENTLIVDDIPSNFYLNPRNGVPIKPYFHAEYTTDHELVLLTKYLVHIAKHCSHFEKLNHKVWKQYLMQNNL